MQVFILLLFLNFGIGKVPLSWWITVYYFAGLFGVLQHETRSVVCHLRPRAFPLYIITQEKTHSAADGCNEKAFVTEPC